jgi:hypothetical protein
MSFGSLDHLRIRTHNRDMERIFCSRLRLLGATLIALFAVALVGCAGVSSGSNTQSSTKTTGGAGTLAVSPTTMNFGNVAVGSSASLNGSLSASTSDVAVSSAAWNGSGYSVSGITFPVTVPAGQSVNYTVTFTPPASGASSGSITFSSNATDPSLNQTFNGNGAQTSTHTVALSWSPSTSTVSGYNLYRGTQTGGPYSTKLNSSLIAGTSFTDSGLVSGTTYYYVSTAVDSNNVESAYSNEASAAIP